MAIHENVEEVYEANFTEPEENEEWDFKSPEDLAHQLHIRKMLQDKLEMKKLKENYKDEWDESEDEFDW